MAKYKIGDKLRCKSGFLSNTNDQNIKGGSGYVSGRIFTIRSVDNYTEEGRTVYWPEESYHPVGTGGVHERAVELADLIVNNYSIY